MVYGKTIEMHTPTFTIIRFDYASPDKLAELKKYYSDGEDG